MLWLKRNLFLAVSGLIVVVLLVVGGLYLFWNMDKNSKVEEDLESSLANLTNLYSLDPFPDHANVVKVQGHVKLLRTKNAALQQSFSPAPAARVSGLQFRSVLDKTLADLHRKAAQANVELPRTNYAFSFDAVRHKASFAPESFPLMPQQLADIEVVCTILFESKAHPLINVRRARVSRDDSQAASDYLTLPIETNAFTGAVVSPYEFEFQCLSEGLASIVQKLAESPHGLIVRSVRTEPVEEKTDTLPGVAPPRPIQPGTPPPPRRAFDGRRRFPYRSRQPGLASPPVSPRRGVRGAAGVPSEDRLITPLKEKRLLVTLQVIAIRPPEKS